MHRASAASHSCWQKCVSNKQDLNVNAWKMFFILHDRHLLRQKPQENHVLCVCVCTCGPTTILWCQKHKEDWAVVKQLRALSRDETSWKKIKWRLLLLLVSERKARPTKIIKGVLQLHVSDITLKCICFPSMCSSVCFCFTCRFPRVSFDDSQRQSTVVAFSCESYV